MGLKVRKFVVGFLTLSVLAGIFLLYLRFNRTPPILPETATKPAPVRAADVNNANTSTSMGIIPGVGDAPDVHVGSVRKTLFLHRDETGGIDRRFGFHELLYEQGNQWGVTKPFMDLLLPELSCRVTADRGTVQVDTTLRQPTLSDAVFSGNVVIHIIPSDPNNAWESFIHLDDVGFLAEKSMFSSTGAVQFLSRNVRLAGTGMELLYDIPRSRLERFRVFELDSLRLRSAEIEALAAVRGKTSRTDKAPEAGGSGATHTPTPDSAAPAADLYQCVFRGNVRLGATQGMVIARDVLAISNIPWPRDNAKDERTTRPAAEPNASESVLSPPPSALDTKASSHLALSAIAEELYDVVVTCDEGFEIGLMSDSREPAGRVQAEGPVRGVPVRAYPEDPAHHTSPLPSRKTPHDAAKNASDAAGPPADRQYVAAQRIDVDVPTGDSTLQGPVAIQVFVDPNTMGDKAGGEPMPMTVTAQQAVRFLRVSEQVVLEGDCAATLHKSGPDARDEYRLTAPRLVLDLAFDANATDDVKAKPRVDLRKLLADQGVGLVQATRSAEHPPVSLSLKRRAPDPLRSADGQRPSDPGAGRLLSWISLEASALEYVTDPGRVLARGPGAVWLHNAETIASKNDPNDSLKPCYVHVANFDVLEYRPVPAETGAAAPARVVAQDEDQQLVLDYFPLVDGRPGPLTQIVAGHVEAALQRIADNRMELVSLTASEGIEYDDEAEHVNFAGSELAYDHRLLLIAIHGDDLRPCRFNGFFVDQIEIDRKNGRLKALFPSASILQISP